MTNMTFSFLFILGTLVSIISGPYFYKVWDLLRNQLLNYPVTFSRNFFALTILTVVIYDVASNHNNQRNWLKKGLTDPSCSLPMNVKFLFTYFFSFKFLLLQLLLCTRRTYMQSKFEVQLSWQLWIRIQLSW